MHSNDFISVVNRRMASLDYAAFSSDELEFMAENELVRIEPKFAYSGLVNFIMVSCVQQSYFCCA